MIASFLSQYLPPLFDSTVKTAPYLIARLILMTMGCALFFYIFPKMRKYFLLTVSILSGFWILGSQVFSLILISSILFWGCLKFLSIQSRYTTLTQWMLIVIYSALYFGIMNSDRWGFEHPKVQDLGLSYLYLRYIHMTVDIKNKKLTHLRFDSYLLYLFYFPTMLAGPVELYQKFFKTPFFEGSSWKPIWSSDIPLRILGGIFKIYLCLHFLELDYDHLWDQTDVLSYMSLLKIMYIRAISFYLFVSGANDISLMHSKFLGIPLIENYHYPYFQKNLGHFWKNWHISFSNILRDYAYEPLGGKNKHQHLNYYITFMLCAMWHVTTPAFVIWGFLHGFGMSTLRLWQNLWNQWFFKIPVLGPLFRKLNLFFKSKPRLGYFIGCLITFHFVALAWLPFWGGHPQGTLAMLRLLGIAKDPEAWMLLLKKFDW